MSGARGGSGSGEAHQQLSERTRSLFGDCPSMVQPAQEKSEGEASVSCAAPPRAAATLAAVLLQALAFSSDAHEHSRRPGRRRDRPARRRRARRRHASDSPTRSTLASRLASARA